MRISLAFSCACFFVCTEIGVGCDYEYFGGCDKTDYHQSDHHDKYRANTSSS